VVVMLEGFGRMGDGPPVPTAPYAYVCTLQGGRIVRMQDFPDRADALAEVGLAPEHK
jgi:ketosteroid isomerase-like protein